GLEKLKNSKVAVFGIGGVGSYSLEALARSGVGTIYIYDNDTVSSSNINRQLIADITTVGKFKTEVAASRTRLINPDINIIENPIFVTHETPINFKDFDFIIDAIDNVTAKLYLICEAKKADVPLISVMGTGNKLDPSRLKISDIYKTDTCPLARVMRLELKKRGIKNQDVIWSDEIPVKSSYTEDFKGGSRPAPASMSFVPGAAGLLAASAAVKTIIENNK
ncbi:MAG: tRNA threonylcarbamoyladenosine dehydratase, partial [Clostridia bacterium]|nr:tRNA threonylcarbamoyladenosine dehydratase [Clostridia bacterium]